MSASDVGGLFARRIRDRVLASGSPTPPRTPRILVASVVLVGAAAEAGPQDRIAVIPAKAPSFAAIDLEAARRSPALVTAAGWLLRAIDLDPGAPELRAARAVVIAGVPGLPAARTVPGGAAPRGALAYGAIWIDPALGQELAQVTAELGKLRWAAGTVEVSDAGITLAGSAAFADPYAAAQLAVSFGMLKKLVATEYPAVEKLSLAPMGATVWFRATLTERELASLVARR